MTRDAPDHLVSVSTLRSRYPDKGVFEIGEIAARSRLNASIEGIEDGIVKEAFRNLLAVMDYGRRS